MSAPLQASMSDSDPLAFAGKAQVLYSIGPRYVESDRQLFRKSDRNSTPATPAETSLWDSLLLPKEGFLGRVTPLGWQKILSGGDPTEARVKAVLTQKEGYYRLAQELNVEGEALDTLHEFRLPIYRSLALGRTFDEAFHVERTSIHGVNLGASVGMDFHYRNKEQRYETGMTHRADGHSVGVKHIGEGTGTAPDTVAAKRVDAYMAETYQLQYGVGF